ncbi:autotransporter domain-containing protein [Novosphingobium aureum]|nr:autotransporter domain-containing protein [Novosphingobium aureum]
MHATRRLGARTSAFIIAASALFAQPVSAQQVLPETPGSEGDRAESNQAQANLQRDEATARDEVAAPPPSVMPWSASVSAGLSARDAGPDGSWQSLALSRSVGRGYLRASVMRYHGTLVQADTALPSDYFIGTLGAGGNFDNWVTDGWVSIGRQRYGRISQTGTDQPASRESTGATSSPYFAVGADVGHVITLSPGWYATPTLAVSYAHGQLLRPAPENSGLPDLETDEPTWTGGANLRLDRAFGPEGRNFIGLLAARQWSSNGVSALLLPVVDDSAILPELKSRHYPDSWYEAGASASLSLLPRLDLDLYATRSFGMKAGDVTSAGLSLRTRF